MSTVEILDATRDNFRELVAHGEVLVDIWGPDCRTCLALFPQVEALAVDHVGEVSVVKLEAPKARRLCMELGVMSLPAFLLFRDGEEVSRLSDPNLSAGRLTEWFAQSRKGVS